jgi:hypothetical protein
MACCAPTPRWASTIRRSDASRQGVGWAKAAETSASGTARLPPCPRARCVPTRGHGGLTECIASRHGPPLPTLRLLSATVHDSGRRARSPSHPGRLESQDWECTWSRIGRATCSSRTSRQPTSRAHNRDTSTGFEPHRGSRRGAREFQRLAQTRDASSGSLFPPPNRWVRQATKSTERRRIPRNHTSW